MVIARRFNLLVLFISGETGADLVALLMGMEKGKVTALVLKASDFKELEARSTDVDFFESGFLLDSSLVRSMVGKTISGLAVGRGEFELLRTNLGRTELWSASCTESEEGSGGGRR